jgi:hypothetical protein
MFRRLFLMALSLASMTGCVIYGNENYAPGDVTISWTFAGYTCSEDPSVRTVVVRIPGEALYNDGAYPCSSYGFPGIELHDFNGGVYSYSVEAYGYDNELLYVASGNFQVDGDTRVSVDLMPPGGPNSYAFLTWSFPANSQSMNPSCASAGVTDVTVRIDNGAPTTFNCADGTYGGGVQTPYLSAGFHSIEFTATDSTGYTLYRFTGDLQTFAGNPVAVDYELYWAVGGTAVEWRLFDSTTERTCSTANIQWMTVNFKNLSTGKWIYGSQGNVQPCNGAPIVYNFLPPGRYSVYIYGEGTGGYYSSSSQNPVTVTVVAGEFVSEFDAVSVNMYRVP